MWLQNNTSTKISDNKMNLVTIKQAKELRDLGFVGPTMRHAYRFDKKHYKLQHVRVLTTNVCDSVLCVPTVDEAIDFIRKKYNIIIYNRIAPFVDEKTHKIYYSYAVKYCNKLWGWNHRKYIGSSKTSANIYAMKRSAITIAIRHIKKDKK